MGEILKQNKVIAKCQAIAKEFVLALQTRRKEFWGDVRLHAKENHFEGRTHGDSYIKEKYYGNTLIYTVSLSRSRAFGVAKKDICELKMVLAYAPAGDYDSSNIRIIAGKVDVYLPVKPRAFGDIQPYHAPEAHPLLQVIDKVRTELSAAFGVPISKDKNYY